MEQNNILSTLHSDLKIGVSCMSPELIELYQ